MSKSSSREMLAISMPDNSLIKLDGELYKIDKIEYSLGKSMASVQLCSVKDGLSKSIDFTNNDKVTVIDHTIKQVEYWYPSKDDEQVHEFFDINDLSIIKIDKSIFEEKKGLIKSGEIYDLILIDNEVVGLMLSRFIEIEVSRIVSNEEEPSNAETIGGNIIVELETGMHISVPSYIERSDIIKIDTRNRVFVQRF